jgi:cytochrome oxidase Cu insertion factor (SCO1/SenC/PrrC family)
MARVAAALAILGLLAGAMPAAADDARKLRYMDELMRGAPGIGGAAAARIVLTDQHGAPRRLEDFRGKLMVLVFGYTHCPDVCPADLYAATLAMERLGPLADAVQPVFVTLDPARDTPRQLAIYAGNFHPRLVALTGAAAAIRALADAHRVYFAIEPRSGPDDYLLEHTAFVFFVGRDGRYLGFAPPGSSAERLEALLRPLLAPEAQE